MKRILFILLINILCQALLAQDYIKSTYPFVIDQLDEFDEIKIRVYEPDIQKVTAISKQFSVDNYQDKYIYLYLTKSDFNFFTKYTYEIEFFIPGLITSKNPQMAHSIDELTQNWDLYPTYDVYINLLLKFAENYPELCKLVDFGNSIEGRKLLAVKISDNVENEETEPEFLYTSTMHGDETTGFVLMLRLIDYLLSNYGTDNYVTGLVDNIEIWINPLANPDGTYNSGNDTIGSSPVSTRSNANGADLNRDYTTPGYIENPSSWEVETSQMITFMKEHNFVLSMNFHGGIEVLNYPWDYTYTRHIDDAWFQFICREYADTVHIYSPSGYLSSYNNGITNGADWYVVNGSRQDYTTHFLHGREVTGEISTTKCPDASTLDDYWEYNYRSLLNYINQCNYGIHGVVTDAFTQNPLKAKITIEGHDLDSSIIYSKNTNGEYHRLIEEGSWTVTYSAFGYLPQTIYNVSTANYETTIKNIELVSSETVSISGTISDGGTGLSIDSVKIELTGTLIEPVYTNTEGNYSINNVLEGIYDIRVSKIGYASLFKSIDVTQESTVFNFTIYPSTDISFETGDFSEADFEFSGDANWTVVDTLVYDGLYTARSGVIGHGQSTSLMMNIDVLAAGQISFYKKISSENGCDFLSFHIDGERQGEWSSTVDWSEAVYYIPTGEHTLTWRYAKDGNTSHGDDAAWIDFITLPIIDDGENFAPYYETSPVTLAKINEEYSYNIIVNDLNQNDTLIIECSRKPVWLDFEMDEINSAILSGIPSDEDLGFDTIHIIATDEIDTTQQNYIIEIVTNSIFENKLEDKSLEVYPNPVKNNINISFNSLIDNKFEIAILNCYGIKVLSYNSTKSALNAYNIDISSLQNGLYFLIVSTKEKKYVNKFIKSNN